MKRSRINPVSKKNAASKKKMRQPRLDYLAELQFCVVNRRPANQVHEIVGGGLRFITFEDDRFWLPTNDEGHKQLQYEPKALQLARKFVYDPTRFNLQRFNELYKGPGAPITKADIAKYLMIKE